MRSSLRTLLRPNAARRALVVGLLLCGCKPGEGGAGGWGKEETKEAPKEQPTPVVATKVAKGTIVGTISAASTIEAEHQITINAESTGRVEWLQVEEGQDVRQGQLLARIKADAQASSLDRAQTTLEQRQREYERVKSLYERKVASREEYDTARIAYDTALLDVRDRNREVKNTKVVAPFTGTITERFVDRGAFVTSGQQLFSLVDFDTLVATVYVPEKELDRIRVGQPADVVGKAARGRRATGTVRRIAPVVDASTGTIKVTVGLPKDNANPAQGFLPGMYAEVTLTTEQHDDALLLAKPALVMDDEQAFVFVITGNRVTRKRIELGLTDTHSVEVLDGLTLADDVVLIGHGGLKEGALVQRVDESGKPLEPMPDAKSAKPEVANKASTAATAPAATAPAAREGA